MQNVNLDRLLAILDAHPGAAIVTMVTRTEPRLLRKSRRSGQPCDERWPHGIEKLVRGRFMLANRYAANVRAQRRRENHPRAEAFQRAKLWRGKGQRIGRFLARHQDSGELYLVARPAADERGQPVRLWERWIDLATGRDIVGEEFTELAADWLRDLRGSNPKQQLARQIPYRTYHVVAIHSVTIGGAVYRLASPALPPPQ
jgi:hypothetical protein